jgi:hypothetical protein
VEPNENCASALFFRTSLLMRLCNEIDKGHSGANSESRVPRLQAAMFSIAPMARAIKSAKLREILSQGGLMAEYQLDRLCAFSSIGHAIRNKFQLFGQELGQFWKVSVSRELNFSLRQNAFTARFDKLLGGSDRKCRIALDGVFKAGNFLLHPSGVERIGHDPSARRGPPFAHSNALDNEAWVCRRSSLLRRGSSRQFAVDC